MPRVIGFKKILCCRPRVCKVFFFFSLRWAPRPFGGARAKKKTPPKVFFFLLRPRGKAREGEAPLEAGTGPEQKKKKTPPRVFFFLLRPRRKARGGEAPLEAGTGPEQKKKNTNQGVFFFCSGPGERQGKEKPRWAPARGQSCGPARTLTHSLRAWVAMPPPRRGGVFFFCCGPARTGVVLFFLLWPRPDAHSLTVGWGDFGKARVVFFFLLRPRRVFLDNSKKCLGYYIGSKKTRRGHSKKKTPLPQKPTVLGVMPYN